MPDDTKTHPLPATSPQLFLELDRFIFFQLAEEKGISPPDYRHYLRMWAKEKEVQKETIKDLPKMNQVGPFRAHNRHFQGCLPTHTWQLPTLPPSTLCRVEILLPTSSTC